MAPLKPTHSSSIRPNPRPNPVLKWLACALLVICAAVLAASVWASMTSDTTPTDPVNNPSPLSEGQPSSPSGPHDPNGNSSIVIEEGAHPTVTELKIARKLADEGNSVIIRRIANDGRTSDFLVNGVETELKTVSNLTGKDASAALSSRILEGAGQARSIIIDVSEQMGMTRQIAGRSIMRVWGRVRVDSILIDTIRIIGQDFDISSIYVP